MSLLKAIALVAFSALCAGGAFAAWRVAALARSIDLQLPPLVAQAQATLGGAQTSLTSTAESLQAATASLQSTAGAASSTISALRVQIAPIASQVNLDLEETHNLILESGLTAMEARKASAEERAALPGMTAKAGQSLDALHAELAALQATTVHLDALVSDPANAQTLKSLSDGSASMAEAAKDGQQFLHAWLHPTWPHKVWGVCLDVAHVFNPL